MQEAVNRIQPEALSRAVIRESRDLGFDSVNVDLIYGLPYQTVESFSETIEKIIEEQYYGPDLVIDMPIRWGLGFGLPSKEMPIGPNPRAFYWGGWGGSVIVVDLDARVSFSYVMNKMSANTMGDRRVFGPAVALYGCLV